MLRNLLVVALAIQSAASLQFDSNRAWDHLRQLVALRERESDEFEMVDVLVQPDGSGNDRRIVEECVDCLSECQAIADDYVRLAEKLGWPPMPDTWW